MPRRGHANVTQFAIKFWQTYLSLLRPESGQPKIVLRCSL